MTCTDKIRMAGYRRKYSEKRKAWIRDNPNDPRVIAMRELRREQHRQWRIRNPEAVRKYAERAKPYQKRWNSDNKERISIRRRKYRAENSNYMPAWRRANPEKCREYQRRYERKKRLNSPAFRIRRNLQSRLAFLVRKASTTKTSQTLTLLGCSLDSFLIYLESKFEPGMSWGNYGKWHIDHILPCAIFDLTNPEHQRTCFHFSNLQPLWATVNQHKADKVLI